MNLSPLKDLKGFVMPDEMKFVKYRVLDEVNIFPSMLLTSLENLVIKNCFSSAFEVFFGIVFELSESEECKFILDNKIALASFTCYMQKKTVRKFEELLKIEEFIELVNDIGNVFEGEKMEIIFKVIKEVFRRVKVNIDVYSQLSEYVSKDNNGFYVNLTVFQRNGTYFLFYKNDDFIEDEEKVLEEKNGHKKKNFNESFSTFDEMEKMEFEDNSMKKFVEWESSVQVIEKNNMKIEDSSLQEFIDKMKDEAQRNSEMLMMNHEDVLTHNFLEWEKRIHLLENDKMKLEDHLIKLVNLQETEKEKQRKYEESFKRIENERIERLENERIEKEKIERLEKERIEKERIENERIEKERLEKKRIENERNNKDKFDNEKLRMDAEKRLLRKRLNLNKKLKHIKQIFERSPEKFLTEDTLEEAKDEDYTKCDFDSNNSSFLESPLPEDQAGIDALISESKILESLVLICGSNFCNNCYRMVKRSSLFIKCSNCCHKPFANFFKKSEKRDRKSVPINSMCVSCQKLIIKGEVILCICCYFRNEFMPDFSQTSCGACSDPASISWVDTYVGKKSELVDCGFCQRKVNNMYVAEVCSNCHDQVCLHCLRKNTFIAEAVCGECHNRRKINPLNKRIRHSIR